MGGIALICLVVSFSAKAAIHYNLITRDSPDREDFFGMWLTGKIYLYPQIWLPAYLGVDLSKVSLQTRKRAIQWLLAEFVSAAVLIASIIAIEIFYPL